MRAAVSHLLASALLSICAIVSPALAAPLAQDSGRSPDVALYYQSDVPVDLLKAFNIVVLDPARAASMDLGARHGSTQWFARLSLADLDRLASNPQASFSGRIAELQRAGYSGFMLDDGDALGQIDAAATQRMTKVLAAFAQYLPQVPLLLRNHLQLAQSHAAQLRGVVVDGLYSSGVIRNGLVAGTPDVVRARALQDIHALLSDTRLAVIGLDYCAPHDLTCRRQRAHQLEQDGVIPYVTDPALSVVGVGALEVLPRTILMVQEDIHGDQPVDQTVGVRLYSMPLNYLGYTVQYTDLKHLPDHVTRDRYAGIVVALTGTAPNPITWRDWLLSHIQRGMPVAVLGDFGFQVGAREAQVLGLHLVPPVSDVATAVTVAHRDPMLGFEAKPAPDSRTLNNFEVGTGGEALLSVMAQGRRYDMAGLTPWGGYSLAGNVTSSVNGLQGERWVLQPLDFYRRALKLPQMPVPVTTTENGLRLFFVHIDGDGFASRVEFQGGKLYSGQVLRDQILTRYAIPQTVSVIQGEISRDGLYPALSPTLEGFARGIFALPNVEMASHTFSHPFDWQVAEALAAAHRHGNHDPGDLVYLPIPGYSINMDREIGGAIDYINGLAPPGKKVLIVQWSGDAIPSAKVLAMAWKAGVLNINAGDTTITKSADSWTNISPVAVSKGPGDAHFQVYAGDMNENVFTNDWAGPFYGYRRIRETFALTDTPYRFKPINIYYHFYSATKIASLDALKLAYDYALSKPVLPIYTSEYIRKVLDWQHAAVARKGSAWVIQSGDALRELRWSHDGVPALGGAQDVSGYDRGPDGIYIHMGGSRAQFVIEAADRGQVPRVVRAAGMIRDFSREGRNVQFRFGGYYKPYVQLESVKGCQVLVDGHPQSANGPIRVSGTAAKPLRMHLFEVKCG